MKKVIAVTIVISLIMVAISGCAENPKGGPKGGSVGQGEWFKIDVPNLDVKVKQSETQSVTIKLNRGENFKQDVTLEFKLSRDQGITFEPSKVVVKASDAPEVQLTITASKDAAIGEYIVYVTGTPTTGEVVLMEFKVNVVAP